MKKRFVCIIVVFLILGWLYYLSLPDYKVHFSMSNSHSHGTVRETELDVVVFKLWGYDELIKEIEREHMEVNDYMDTELTINLYHFTTRKNEPFKTVVFEYE